MPKDYLRPANRQQPLLVAIDFGTAYSSVVYYIDTRSPHERAKGLALGKIPLAALKVVGFNRAAQIGTQMAWYDKRQMWLWGHRVDEYIHRKEILESDRIQMAKLYMEHSEMTKPIRDRRALGRHEDPDPFQRCIFEDTDIECWMGVPKLWSPELNEVMVRAALHAGLPKNLNLVHEPEGAALYCFAEDRENHFYQRDLEGTGVTASTPSCSQIPFDNVLIVDAGSGTVDLVTYRLQSRDGIINIEEGVRGTAGLYGSAILNQRFLKLFHDCLERDEVSMILRGQRKRAAVENESLIDFMALKSFEDQKKYFGDRLDDSLDDEPMCISLEGLEGTFESSRTTLGPSGKKIPRAKIVTLFDGIIDEILGMVKQQIKAFNRKYGNSSKTRLKRIMLVGGFAENTYLYQRIVNACSGSLAIAGYDISVTRPAQADVALIARGALLRALHNPVTTKIFTQSYGFKWDESYVPQLHGNIVTELDYHEGYEVAKDRLYWLCKVHHSMDLGIPVPLRSRGTRYVPLEGPTVLWENLYRSYNRSEDHIDIKSRGVEKVGRLVLDFSKIDRRNFRRHTTTHDNLREEFVKLDYEVQLIFDGVRLTYRLIVPELGRWWNWDGGEQSMSDDDWGANPHQVEIIMENVTAAFDVSGYRIRTEPARSERLPSTSTVSMRSKFPTVRDAQLSGSQRGESSSAASILSDTSSEYRTVNSRQSIDHSAIVSRQPGSANGAFARTPHQGAVVPDV
ncbi:hypothetical protein G7Y79_00009g026440 [Physcia stellaris]|nr:hypothetical protein G7Y79_00009g026440 [Physcia stellaris]